MEKVAPHRGDGNLDGPTSNQCLQTQHGGIRWAGNKLGPGSGGREKSLRVTDPGKEGSPTTPSFVLAPEHRDADAPAPGRLKHDGKNATCQVKLNNECFERHAPSSES